MSSFDPKKHGYILLKITHENHEKYYTYVHLSTKRYLGFDLFEGLYFHANIIEHNDYVCSSDEEFDQLIFLHYLEN